MSGLTVARPGAYTSRMTQAARGLSTLAVVCALVAGIGAQAPPRSADLRSREIYVSVLAPYTTDTEVLNQRVRRIFPRTGSGAYLLDAIVDASKALAKREAKRPVI